MPFSIINHQGTLRCLRYVCLTRLKKPSFPAFPFLGLSSGLPCIKDRALLVILCCLEGFVSPKNRDFDLLMKRHIHYHVGKIALTSILSAPCILISVIGFNDCLAEVDKHHTT